MAARRPSRSRPPGSLAQPRLDDLTGATSEDFDDLLDGDFSIWSLAGRLAGPILDGGRRRARIDETLADLRASRAAFAGLALRAFFEVENALDAERRLRERIGHLDVAAKAARAATELAEDQYREGLISIELVLESQRGQFRAESAFLAARESSSRRGWICTSRWVAPSDRLLPRAGGGVTRARSVGRAPPRRGTGALKEAVEPDGARARAGACERR